MIALVTGGARSGKSAYAESLAVRLGAPRWYLATMTSGDEESRARIAHHVAQRAGMGFETFEMCEEAPRLEGGVALLDDLPNLLANRLYGSGADGGLDAEDACATIVRDVRSLSRACDSLVVVTAEVGADGRRYDPGTQAYVAALGALGCAIAAFADLVVEVVAGCALEVKSA